MGVFVQTSLRIAFGIVVSLGFTACPAPEIERALPPDPQDYLQNTTLMLNTANKLAQERDGVQLHRVAVAIQQSRAMACADVHGECKLFGEFMNSVIAVSADEIITPLEAQQMRVKLNELRKKVDEGLRLVKKVNKNLPSSQF